MLRPANSASTMHTSTWAAIAYSIIMAALIFAFVLLPGCGGIIAVWWKCRCSWIAHVAAATYAHLVMLCLPAAVMVLFQAYTCAVVLVPKRARMSCRGHLFCTCHRSVAQSFVTCNHDLAVSSRASLTPGSTEHVPMTVYASFTPATLCHPAYWF